MPILTGVQGYTDLTQQFRLCLENSGSGEQLLLPLTTGAATMSLTTQPNTLSATTGMHLHFYVFGNSTAGNIVITGTNAAGGGQVSTTYHVPIAPQNIQGYSEFTTKEAWATVTAASIVLTTLTPCTIMVFGSYAGKFLLPVSSDAEQKIAKFSPQDKRGILFKNFRVQQLTRMTDLSKLDCSLYPDSLWAYYMLIGNVPVVTTLPASPVSLLAATTVAATLTLTTSLSTVPPGVFLIFTPASNSVAGTIVLAGVDNYGVTVSETIVVGANNTPVYSTKRYASIANSGADKFATTGLSVAGTIAVTAVYAWVYTWTYDGVTNYTPYTATMEVYNGVHGVVLPGTVFTDGTWTWAKEKEIGFSSKGICQDYLIVGDNSPTSTANYLSGTNPFATIAQPTTLPVVSWPASFYLDTLPGGTPLTTQDGHLVDFKVGVTTGRKWVYTGDGQQRPAFITWEAEPDFSLDATLIWENYKYYEQYFLPNAKFALGATFQGNLLASAAGGVTYYEGVTWTLPVKIEGLKIDYTKNPVSATLKLISEYDFTLGYAYKVAVTSQTPPTYTV